MADLLFETDDDRRAILTPSLRLSFHWAGDRWTHALAAPAVGLDEDGSWVELARSVESTANNDDPTRVVSPAYQHLQWREADDGAEAFLVGQSGPHHFSAVVSVREDRGGVVVAVDLADRCRSDVEALACTYALKAPSGALREAGPGRITWCLGSASGPIPEGLLTFSVPEPAQVALAEAGRQAVQVQALAAVVPGRPTHRCLYEWVWKIREIEG